jgi:hypothetical protein
MYPEWVCFKSGIKVLLYKHKSTKIFSLLCALYVPCGYPCKSTFTS